MDFNEAKLRQLEAASTYRVYGHEIDVEGGATGKGAGAKTRGRWRLVSPCFCVWDSPDSPCPCMTDESRWWMLADAVIREGKAGRKDHDGKELQYFDVVVDSKIMVESLRPISAGVLKRLGAAVSPEELRGLISGSGSGGVQTAFSIGDVIKEILDTLIVDPGVALLQSIDLDAFVKGQQDP